MRRKRKTIWEKQASRKLIFFCFLLIIAAFICFGGTYLQFKANMPVEEEDSIMYTRPSTIDNLNTNEE